MTLKTDNSVTRNTYVMKPSISKVKVFCCAKGERRYSSFLTSLDGGEWSVSRPGRNSPPGKGPPVSSWMGGWVGLRASLDTEARGKKSFASARDGNLVVQYLLP
jgi:hypothetical protein